jgi:protein phosphatase 2C family protein 2/3
MNLSQFPERLRYAFNNNHILLGPHRIFPGRLSVSRSFGDIEAKSCRLGGNPGVLIATPEITSFKIDDSIDYIVLGCIIFLI